MVLDPNVAEKTQKLFIQFRKRNTCYQQFNWRQGQRAGDKDEDKWKHEQEQQKWRHSIQMNSNVTWTEMFKKNGAIK